MCLMFTSWGSPPFSGTTTLGKVVLWLTGVKQRKVRAAFTAVRVGCFSKHSLYSLKMVILGVGQKF